MTIFIIGSDEVGYGALAGPLVVCTAMVSVDWAGPKGLKDSKTMSEPAIGRLAGWLGVNITHYFSIAHADEIDKVGVYPMLKQLHLRGIKRALKQARASQSLVKRVVVDGNLHLGRPDLRIQSVVKADATIPVVMAASVLAKHHRDTLMRVMATKPGLEAYGFDVHKGYPTQKHMAALKKCGPAHFIHRFSYAPVKKAANEH